MGISSLDLSSPTFSNSYVHEDVYNSIVCCMPHVVRLNLSYTSCSDETLVCIQKFCRNLESLNVYFCDSVTNLGMENLCRGKLLLKNLNIKYTQVDHLGIVTVLDGMPSLECVEFEKLAHSLYKIGNKKQYNLKELVFYNREQVYYDYADDSKVFQACVEMCPKLKKLHFEHHVYQNVLDACAYFQNLEELKIKMPHSYTSNMSDVLIPILPISENLKTLILYSVSISIVTLVECFKSLENLRLERVLFTPFEKKDIKISKTNLLALVLKDTDMEGATYEGVSLLISLSKNVSILYLKPINHFPPEIYDVILQSMKNLSCVNFDFTIRDMQYVNPFFQIPSMSKIIVGKSISSGCILLGKSTSCTLSWRNMCDIDDDDEWEDKSWCYGYRDCIYDADYDYSSD